MIKNLGKRYRTMYMYCIVHNVVAVKIMQWINQIDSSLTKIDNYIFKKNLKN